MSNEARFKLRLLDRFSKPAKAAAGAADRLAQSFSTARKWARSAGRDLESGRFTSSRWTRLKKFLGGGAGAAGNGIGGIKSVLFGNLLTSAVHRVFDLTGAIVHASAEMVTFGQNSRLAFTQLAKHGAEPEKLFEHARALAKRFGLDVIDTTHAYQDFLKLQFNPKQADQLIRMGADLQSLGTTAEQVQGVFLALGQIKSKGRLQGEEMLQLAERGISGQLIWEEAGKLLGGKTVAEVQKIQQKGKLNADIGLQAIQNAINRKLQQSALGESGAKFADTTIVGMFGRMKAFAQDTGLTIADKLVAPLTKLTSGVFQRFVGFLGSAEGVRFVDQLGDSLASAVDWARKLAGWFGEGFGETFGALKEGASAFFSAFSGGDGSTTIALVKTLARGLGQLTAIAVGFAGAFALVTTGLVTFGTVAYEVGKGILGGLLKPLADIWAGIESWWDSLRALWSSESISLGEKLYRTGVAMVEGLVAGIKSGVTYPYTALKSLAVGAVDGVKSALGIHSPSKVFEGLGFQTSAGFAAGISRGEARVAAASSESFGFDYGAPAASVSSPQPAIAGGASIGGLQLTQHITVQGGGGDANEIAQMTARESRREFEDALRQWAMELG